MNRLAFTAALVALVPSVACAKKDAAPTRLPDGLAYVDLKKGHGPTPKTGQTVTVNYTGKLMDGTVFDASSKHGGTFDFKIGEGQVIKGWDEGVATMRPGGTRKLIIPPDLGYGAQGAGGVIPPNATLVFIIDLIKIT
jgi:FKBP-type peptidyl-prolyl cis-trans isomerase